MTYMSREAREVFRLPKVDLLKLASSEAPNAVAAQTELDRRRAKRSKRRAHSDAPEAA